ncbi:MAG: hypothetical protein ACP5HH_07330 [Fervidicoccaceae archaeon]
MEKEQIKEKLESKNYIIKNKENYKWAKPFFEYDFYVMEGWSILQLFNDEQIPFFPRFDLLEVGEDHIKIRVPGYGDFSISVYAETICREEIEITLSVLDLSVFENTSS